MLSHREPRAQHRHPQDLQRRQTTISQAQHHHDPTPFSSQKRRCLRDSDLWLRSLSSRTSFLRSLSTASVWTLKSVLLHLADAHWKVDLSADRAEQRFQPPTQEASYCHQSRTSTSACLHVYPKEQTPWSRPRPFSPIYTPGAKWTADLLFGAP